MPGLTLECSWARQSRAKGDIGGTRDTPLAAEPNPGAMRAASLPCRQMGPRVALARAGRLGGGGSAPSGFARPWARSPAGWYAAGSAGARPPAGGRGFPLSGDLRGAAETHAGVAPRPSPSRGAGLSFRPGGAQWVWACELSGRRRAPSPGAAQKPRLRCLGFQSPPPPPPSRSGSSPSRLRPCPPPLAVRVALPGVQGGCPGGAARGRGGEPSASRALPASGGRAGRAARGRRARPRSAREEPFVPSQKFACRDRDSCGRGGRRGRRRRRIEAAA